MSGANQLIYRLCDQNKFRRPRILSETLNSSLRQSRPTAWIINLTPFFDRIFDFESKSESILAIATSPVFNFFAGALIRDFS